MECDPSPSFKREGFCINLGFRIQKMQYGNWVRCNNQLLVYLYKNKKELKNQIVKNQLKRTMGYTDANYTIDTFIHRSKSIKT